MPGARAGAAVLAQLVRDAREGVGGPAGSGAEGGGLELLAVRRREPLRGGLQRPPRRLLVGRLPGKPREGHLVRAVGAPALAVRRGVAAPEVHARDPGLRSRGRAARAAARSCRTAALRATRVARRAGDGGDDKE